MKSKKEKHFTALRRQDRLNRLAKERFRLVDGKMEKYQAVLPVRDIEAFIEVEKMANARIGDLVPGKGVFLGRWAPKDSKGKSLGKIFNVFAASKDLPGNNTYEETVKKVAALKKWHGHDGENYANDRKLYEALRKDEYKGGWFIPPLEVLAGVGPNLPAGRRDTPVAQPGNLFDYRDKGAFRNTFATVNGPGKATYYFSSSEPGRSPAEIWSIGFGIGDTYTSFKESSYFSCRPIRLEPARPEPVA